MNIDSTPASINKKTFSIYWASAYFLITSILYLWGYWSVFDINIFEYSDISDIAKSAAYPIASTFIFVVIGAVLGEILFPHNVFPPGGGKDTVLGKFLNRFVFVFVAGYTIGIILLFMFGPDEKWWLVPMLIAIPASLSLKKIGFLEDVILSDGARSTVIFLLAILPPFSYGHGHLKALSIHTGKKFSYTVSSIEGAGQKAENVPLEQPRYIGQAGEQIFFFLPKNNSVLLTKLDNIKNLELKTYPSIQTSSKIETNAKSN